MLNGKKVRDLMLPVSDYPHVPEDATIKEAMARIKRASEASGGRFRFRSVLVMDGGARLKGVLSIRDLLKAVEPGFLKAPKGFEGYWPDKDAGLAEMLKDVFSEKCRQEADKKVGEVLAPVKASAGPDDSVAKAVYLMVQEDMTMLPVIEKGSVVGAVRLIDLFQEVRDMVLDK